MFVNFIELQHRFTRAITGSIPSYIVGPTSIIVPTCTYIPLRRRQDSWGVGVIGLYSMLRQIHEIFFNS
jgi:hypothetical protein